LLTDSLSMRTSQRRERPIVTGPSATPCSVLGPTSMNAQPASSAASCGSPVTGTCIVSVRSIVVSGSPSAPGVMSTRIGRCRT
jgi:hypothetical protein